MSEATNQTETQAVFTREDGTQYIVEPFKLSKTKEVADRFRGDHVVNIPLPVAVKGTTVAQFLANPQNPENHDTLISTLCNLAAFVSPEADLGEVLVAKFTGQGLRLDTQKVVKDFLAPRTTDDTETVEVNGEQVLVKDAPVEVVLAAAQKVADEERLGAPRKRGAGKGAGKVAQAEAKAAKAINTAVQMYRDLPEAMRANYRQALIDTGSVTSEELDAVDQELAALTAADAEARREHAASARGKR